MQEKIFIRQWLDMKPYNQQTKTDSYYLRLANKVRQVFAGRNYMVLSMYLNNSEISSLACFLTSWFEDIISQTGIYRAFLTLHNKQYDKKLPFYDTTDYVEGEINEQDVAFLTWYFLNTMQHEKFISPYNDFIDNIASGVMEIFDAEYEIAYENTLLQSLYSLDDQETDYFYVRNFIDRLFFNSYLFFSDTNKELIKMEEEVIAEYKKEPNLAAMLQENRDWYLHDTCTRLMAAPAKEWAAVLLGDSHPRSSDIRKLSQKIRGIFTYRGQNDTDVFIEHVASGKQFNLTKKSFEFGHELTLPGNLMFIGIINWRNEWWFSGSYAAMDFDADIVLREKNSPQSRAQVSFLDHPVHNTGEFLHQQAEAFKNYNNGSLIAFMTADKMPAFIDGFMDYYNKLTDPEERQSEAAGQRAKKEGYFGDRESRLAGMPDTGEPGLVFCNPKSGIEMAFHVNSAFPLPGNPWFTEADSEEDIFFLFISKDHTAELAYYCIENCSDGLPYLNSGEGKKLLVHIDFLLRFWKGKNYHPEQRVGYIGANG